MPTSEVIWSKRDDIHFHMMCTNRFRPETPAEGVRSAFCDVCMNPLEESEPDPEVETEPEPETEAEPEL